MHIAGWNVLRVIVVASVAAILAIPVAHAGPLEDGISAYIGDDIAKARRLLQPLADRGDPVAQKWIGDIYYNGRDAAPNYAEALRWFHQSGGQGYPPAQTAIAQCYRDGMGVPMDLAEAARWYLMAASGGDRSAVRNLAVMYRDGKGLAQDFVQSYRWFEIEVQLLMPYAKSDEYAGLTADRDNVGAKMTSTQLGEAQRLANGQIGQIRQSAYKYRLLRQI